MVQRSWPKSSGRGAPTMGVLVLHAAALVAAASTPMNHDAPGGPGGTYKVRAHLPSLTLHVEYML
jgi:hypothetical protein